MGITEQAVKQTLEQSFKDFDEVLAALKELTIPDRTSEAELRFQRYLAVDLKPAQRAIALQAIRFLHRHAPYFDSDVDSRWSFVRATIAVGPDHLNTHTAAQLMEQERKAIELAWARVRAARRAKAVGQP